VRLSVGLSTRHSHDLGVPGVFCCHDEVVLKYLDDALVVVGVGLIVLGVARIDLTAAMIVAGLFCIAGGIVIGKAGSQ
jgi:hypothetical protein